MSDNPLAIPAPPPVPKPLLPRFRDLAIRIPIYEAVKFDVSEGGAHYDRLDSAKFGALNFDAHCVGCGQTSTFRAPALAGSNQHSVLAAGYWERSVQCARNQYHRMYFYFRQWPTAEGTVGTLTKVGQWPALADLHLPNIQKYREPLNSDYADLARAIGLATHGIGIGSYVYLRRVFENLIDETKAQAIAQQRVAEEQFKDIRMDEKIALLADLLPPLSTLGT